MFQGIDKNHPHGGFNFFTGVVEDRLDPKKLGRVKVRIHGIHTDEKQLNEKTGRGFLSEDLPWATPMMPVTTAAMDGIGETPKLVEGTWVCGFARDGRAMNDLIIMGTINGMPSEVPYTGDKLPKSEQEIGFQDPREESDIETTPRKFNKEFDRDPSYPDQKIPMGRYPQEKFIDEPSINRLARGEKLDDTINEEKKTGEMRFGEGDEDLRKKQEKIETALGTEWDEPDSAYAAKYPYNNVKETESGHVVEFDDTPDNERIHEYHRWGTYKEIDARGRKVTKVIGDNFQLMMKDDKVYIKGNGDITTDGNWTVYAKDSITIKGDKKIDIESDVLVNVTSKAAIKMAAPEVLVTSPSMDVIGTLKVNGKPVA